MPPPQQRWQQRRRRRRPCAAAGNGVGSRGLLARVTTAAALAVAVTTPLAVGVGAATEAECADVSLLLTQDELMESPRADTATEAAAAGIDGRVVATQATYDRMEEDQLKITELEGRDEEVPFRNLWSDHTWLGTAEVTFPGTAVKNLLLEGSPPDFNCMNEHYGLSFEKIEDGATFASGTLTADKVLNWDLLGPDYLAVEGVSSFVPSDVQTVPSLSTVNLVAAREHVDDTDLIPTFHYFLTEPAEDVDPSTCPEPCTGEVVSYYLSASAGRVYLLDRVSLDDTDPPPCWSDLYEAVADGPPAAGVDVALWDDTALCTVDLLQAVEDARNTAGASSSAGDDDAGEGLDGGTGGADGGSSAGLVAAVLIPVLLVSFAAAAFGRMRHQKGQRLKKMMATEEAWGEVGGGGGGGVEKQQRPRPPTGRFKLGLAAVAGASGIATLKSFPPPERVFTDVTIDEREVGLGRTSSGEEGTASSGGSMSDAEEGRARSQGGDEEDEEGEDMVYPM